ncbi:MAG: ROK family protein [Candidatus Marinimicrobia bacterium]|nr:ROK family protein [Candidatus Neomarinimicrobiota bacterium]MCK4447647.1 ROK family protein [Candidatus Neomarinimicrobiota bacterium]
MKSMLDKTIIGVDLGGTKIQVGRIKQNKIEQEFYRPISADEEEEIVLAEVIEAIEQVYSKDVDSIGVGVPGIVNVERGIVYDIVNIPSWKEVFLKDRLEDRFDCTVYVNNDANCFALGEKYFGKARGYQNVVGITLGTGLGAGIIIHNHLYTGKNCGAGEFGMISYNGRNYEYYCSGSFFKKVHHEDGQDLYIRAGKGDSIALEIFRQFGYHMGQVISTILFATDPEIIVLGGSISRSYPFYKDEMWRVLNTFPYKPVREQLIIEITDSPKITILGAGALYYDAQN